jgi:hypothetical protein
MRDWIRRLKAYFAASNMSSLDVPEQKEMFMACISQELAIALEPKLDVNSDIMACYGILEEHFLALKPLFTRRLDLFQMEKGSRNFKQFYDIVRRAANEAELDKITPDELIIFVLLSGIQTDTNLFMRLRELQQPTVQDLLIKAEIHERTLYDVTTFTRTTPLHAITAVESEEQILAAVASACQGCGRPTIE